MRQMRCVFLGRVHCFLELKELGRVSRVIRVIQVCLEMQGLANPGLFLRWGMLGANHANAGNRQPTHSCRTMTSSLFASAEST